MYKFRNIINDFDVLSYEEKNYEYIDNDISENCEDRIKIIYNQYHRQSIIFCEYRFEGEKHLNDVADIPNYISSNAYDYICNVLNNNDDITVFWSQVYGTTSDYVIIYNNYFTSFEEYKSYISNNLNFTNYKYKEYKNGEVKKCNF